MLWAEFCVVSTTSIQVKTDALQTLGLKGLDTRDGAGGLGYWDVVGGFDHRDVAGGFGHQDEVRPFDYPTFWANFLDLNSDMSE